MQLKKFIQEIGNWQKISFSQEQLVSVLGNSGKVVLKLNMS